MSDELEKIEAQIEEAKKDQGGAMRLQRLYLERERAQERQFKASLARRRKAAK